MSSAPLPSATSPEGTFSPRLRDGKSQYALAKWGLLFHPGERAGTEGHGEVGFGIVLQGRIDSRLDLFL